MSIAAVDSKSSAPAERYVALNFNLKRRIIPKIFRIDQDPLENQNTYGRHLYATLHPITQFIVFAVKSRQALIPNRHKSELHQYITGIVTNRKQKMIQINSMPDHIHILVGITPDIAISDLVRDIIVKPENMFTL